MSDTDITDRLLTAMEAGALLGLKTSTVRKLTYTRELPCVRPTGKRCVRYRRKDLEALLTMRTQPMRSEGRHRSSQCKGQTEAAYEEAPPATA